jgi:hypothetical protein
MYVTVPGELTGKRKRVVGEATTIRRGGGGGTGQRKALEVGKRDTRKDKEWKQCVWPRPSSSLRLIAEVRVTVRACAMQIASQEKRNGTSRESGERSLYGVRRRRLRAVDIDGWVYCYYYFSQTPRVSEARLAT